VTLTKYTGKDVAATYKVSGPFTLVGVKTLEITETAKPLPEQMDTTTVGAAYEQTEDPLGGKGTAKTTVTVNGLLSKADLADAGYTALAMNAKDTLTIHPAGATLTYNKCLLANALFRGIQVTAAVRDWVAFRATWEANEVPTWSAVSA
jgi:hypothetical protein